MIRPHEKAGSTLTAVRHHAIISGTGRAGTTFLVSVLTRCGVETGFGEARLELDDLSRAGLESDVRKDDAPYLVKSPWFCDYADEIFARPDIKIDHLFIPMRDLSDAATSRAYVNEQAMTSVPLLQRVKLKLRGRRIHPSGGLLYADDAGSQEDVLLRRLYALMLAASKAEVPVTLLNFPLLTEQPAYLYEKLTPILGDVDAATFEAAFERTVRPEWVSRFKVEG